MRSNSFNVVPVRDIVRPAGSPCPLRLAGAPADDDPARELMVRLRDRMRLHRTDTADFTPEELARTRRLGQLYADVSQKLFPDDFARDLVKLALSSECRACELSSRCAGCYEPDPRNVFARDDARLRAIVRSLEGRVVELGCGDGSYAAEIAPQVGAGRATYLGVDPDPSRIELLRSRHPWARYHVGTAENLLSTPPAKSFDHVLVLQSYNHFSMPRPTLELAVGALSLGGTLVVADNVAFGLVRGREHAARAESGPGAFEHHRNDSAEEAHETLRGLPLALIERRDVGPDTSNQWLLRYERIALDRGGEP